jgi:hypothetical protein
MRHTQNFGIVRIGRDGYAAVKHKPMSKIAQISDAFHGGMRGKVKLAAVLHEQRNRSLHSLGMHARCLPVWSTELLKSNIFLIEQAIGGFQIAPLLRLFGKACRGLGGNGSTEPNGPTGATNIPKRGIALLGFSPRNGIGRKEDWRYTRVHICG